MIERQEFKFIEEEELALASTDPQYDKSLFKEFHEQSVNVKIRASDKDLPVIQVNLKEKVLLLFLPKSVPVALQMNQKRFAKIESALDF